MNEIEVEKQVEQMVRFIKQEAEEKSSEIKVSAEEEFNLEKLQLLEQERAKIRKEYERREGQVEVRKKIEYSKLLNEMRLKVLAAREAAIQEIVTDARAQLMSLTKDPAAYKKLLTDLLVQGMKKLGESSVVVKVRQIDLPVITDVITQAKKQYAAVYGEEAPSLQLDQTDFLPPPPTGQNSEIASCCGGVHLSSVDGRIVCSNTLDDRLKIAYQANLPEIRKKLFGA